MRRKEDLEQHIRASYDLILKYEDIQRDTDRPEERLRAQRIKDEQWELIKLYLAEYISLCQQLGIAAPDDIAQLATRFNYQISARDIEDFHSRSKPLSPILPPRPFLIGRDVEIVKITELLEKGERVIAITGVGGIGKTALALELAHQQAQADSVVIWESAVEGGALNVDEIESSIWKTFVGGVCTLRPQERREWILRTLARHKILLFLDNLEDAEDTSGIFQLVSQFPRPSVTVITTREHISPALGVSLELDRLSEDDAASLFEHIGERVNQRVQNEKEHEIVRVICGQDILDGHPLAIEIAASLWDELSLQDILRGVKLDPMATLVDPRRWDKNQSVLRSLNLSYARLGKRSIIRRLFTRLGVFQAAVHREAIEAVCEISNPTRYLGALVRKSLVHFDGRRYSLHPVVRIFAREKLKNRSYYELRAVQYFLDYAKEYIDDFDALEQEIDNILAAMEIADTRRRNRELALEYFDILGPFLQTRGYWGVIIERGERALKIAKLMADDVAVARYSNNLARIHLRKGDAERAIQLLRDSLDIQERTNDYGGYADSLYLLGAIAADRGNYEKATELYQESLNIRQQLGDQGEVANIFHQLGNLASMQGNFDQARRFYKDSMRIKQELGQDDDVAAALQQLGLIEQEQGNWAEAERFYRQSLEIERKVGDQEAIASATHMLGTIAFQRGDYKEALRLFDESVRVSRRLGAQKSIGLTLVGIGLVYQYQGDFDQATQYYCDALDIFSKLEDPRNRAATLQKMGMLAQERHNFTLAKELYEDSLEISQAIGDQHVIAATLHQLGIMAENEGDYEQAEKLYKESLEINKRLENLYGIETTLHQLGNLAYRKGEFDKARRLYIESLVLARRLGSQYSVGESLHQLGNVALQQGRYAKARCLFRMVMKIMGQLGNPGYVANALHSLGVTANSEGRQDEALQLCQQALSMRRELDNKAGIADSLAQIGFILYNQVRYDEAAKACQESLSLYEELGLSDSQNARTVQDLLEAIAYDSQNY